MFHAKIHRATVTEADLDYEGSITIDLDLLEAAGMKVYEQVDVLDISNGNRLTTYTLPGEHGSGEIKMNGAAAHLIHPGDLIIVIAYASFEESELADFHPTVVLVDEKNRIREVRKG